MEQPPSSEKSELEEIVKDVPPSPESDVRAILEAGETYGKLDMIRKAVEDPLKTVFGSEVKVVDFQAIEGAGESGKNKFRILIEVGKDGDVHEQVVEIPA